MQRSLIFSAVTVLLLVAATGQVADAASSGQVAEADEPFLLTYPNLADSRGKVVLSNEHVVLQRLVVPAGKWEGVHSHPGNQVYVHIRGGEWSGMLGGKREYTAEISEDGGVGWMDPIPLSAGHNSGNTGDAPIELIYVTMKSDTPIAPSVEHTPQSYPGITPEVLLENHRVIVQKLQLAPGQWTGPHSHPGHQVFLHISGGTWSDRHDGGEAGAASKARPGDVGWLDATDPGELHDVGNSGDAPMELVLVTLK